MSVLVIAQCFYSRDNIGKIAMTTKDAWKSVQNNLAGDHWSILISIQLDLPVFR